MAENNTPTKLNLKWGLHANLNNTSETLGNIYITTDTGAMYVDVPGEGTTAERKRISGSVMYFETLSGFAANVKPPYDTTMIYFIEKAEAKDASGEVTQTETNALVRWVLDDAEKNEGHWVQINTPKDLYNTLSATVNGLVDDMKAVKAYGALIEANTAAIAANKALIDTNTAAIAAINAELGLGSGQGSSGNESLLSRVATLETTLSTEAGYIDTLQEESKQYYQDIEDLKGQATSLDGRLDTLESVGGELVTDVANLKTTVGDSGKGLVKAVSELQDTTKNNGADIAALKATVGDTNKGLVKQVATLEAASTDYSGRIAGLEATVGNANSGLVKNVASLQDEVKTLATQDSVTALSSTLTKEINDKIIAVNAMRYIGAVGEKDDLPISGVMVGDTYVVSKAFDLATNTPVKPGDLLVAHGDEATEGANLGIITSNLGWHIVKTGYDATLEQTLVLTDNTIGLQGYAADKGELQSSITVSAKSENIEIITTAGKANEDGTFTPPDLSFSLVWGTF